MSRSLVSSLLGALALAGCSGGVDLPEPAPVETDTDSVDTDVVVDCNLVVEPAEAFVLPEQDVVFSLRGGTGDVTWSLEDNQSGALIGVESGRYLSGATPERVDTVRAEDAGCPGVATATVTVMREMTVVPEVATLPPDTGFSLEIRGGSGQRTCSTVIDATGGSLSGCSYRAGSRAGIDELLVTDEVTGQEVALEFTVREGASLDLPAPRIALPIGSELPLPVLGGSGEFRIGVSGVGSATDGVYSSNESGHATLEIEDRFVGLRTTLLVDVLEPMALGQENADGELTSTQQVMRAGDLDGDGYDDVVITNPEAAFGGWRSGLVGVWRGGPSGLEAEPDWTWSGSAQLDQGGYQVALGDFDADGETDLVVTAWEADILGSGDGMFALFLGVSGGTFRAEPDLVVAGQEDFDRRGRGVVACDFDGDGYDDLAVSSYTAEDRNQSTVETNQGAVDVFLGGAAGLADEPDQRIWGMRPDGDGGWVGAANQNLALTLAAGDVDGDGRCDLVASNWNQGLTSASTAGTVLVYAGNRSGVDEEPSRVWTISSGDDNADLGRAIATGDVDGDGAAEVLMGAWRRDDVASEYGAAYLAHGGPFDDPVVIEIDDVAWRMSDQRYDYTGMGVALGDLDGDGLDEVLVGSPQDEGSVNASGAVRVYDGARVGAELGRRRVDASRTVPDRLYGGARSFDWYGGSIDVVGDVDGDGETDVAVWAYRDDLDGPDAGGVYIVSGADAGPGRRTSVPSVPANHDYGIRGSLAFVNTDRSGAPVLVASGPRDHDGDLSASGRVAVLVPRDEGAPVLRTDDLVDRPVRSYFEEDGLAVSSAGDFDGDGFQDLVVMSFGNDRPGTPGAGFVPTSGCPGGRSNAGAAWIYRGGARDAIASQPSAVQWGPIAQDYAEAATGGFDHDGDGYDDVLVATTRIDANRGGFSIMWGGPLSGSGIDVYCDDAYVAQPYTGSRMGSAAVALGDLNGDGCDEVAVAADADDLTSGDAGSVRIFWGWGGSGCPAAKRVTTLASPDNGARLGTSLDGGVDVDGDRVPDLIMGAPNTSVGGDRRGLAWFVSGADLVGLGRNTYSTSLPASGSVNVHVLGRDVPAVPLDGDWPAARFGESVGLVPGVGVAVGAPRAGWGDTADVGRVMVFPVEDRELSTEPSVILLGELDAPGSRFGSEVVGSAWGGRPVLGIGAEFHDGVGVDAGGVYVWRP